MSDADRDNAVEPVVLRGRRLEQGIDSEIVARRIDDLAFFDSFDKRDDVTIVTA